MQSGSGTVEFGLVVFDFDGTLCDSADVKTEAFYELYLDERGPAFAQAVHAYHLENMGISRYDKIRHIEREFTGKTPTDERVEQVANRFSVIVEDAVVASPLFDGVLEYLSSDDLTVPVAIASATPTRELRRIVERKGISDFFSAVEGSPRSKGEILSGFSAHFGIPGSAVVMVGDQPSDAQGARDSGTDALLIASGAIWADPFHSVATFDEAAAWLNERTSVAS